MVETKSMISSTIPLNESHQQRSETVVREERTENEKPITTLTVSAGLARRETESSTLAGIGSVFESKTGLSWSQQPCLPVLLILQAADARSRLDRGVCGHRM